MNITLLSPEESVKIISELKGGPGRGNHRAINLVGGVSFVGSAEVTCREEKTGEVVWHDKVENAITDYGRRRWMDNLLYQMVIAASGNTEAIDFRRSLYTGPGGTNDVPETGTLTVSKVGMTGSWSTTFSAPSSTRTIGTICLGSRYDNQGLAVWAGLLLSPPKTQTTSQTLEVIYKLTATGIA